MLFPFQFSQNIVWFTYLSGIHDWWMFCNQNQIFYTVKYAYRRNCFWKLKLHNTWLPSFSRKFPLAMNVNLLLSRWKRIPLNWNVANNVILLLASSRPDKKLLNSEMVMFASRATCDTSCKTYAKTRTLSKLNLLTPNLCSHTNFDLFFLAACCLIRSDLFMTNKFM